MYHEFREENNKLYFSRRSETVIIEAWGEGLRVRATKNHDFSGKDRALLPGESRPAKIRIGEQRAEIQNGNITAQITDYGKLTFYNQRGELLLKEYYRSWDYGGRGDGNGGWEDLDQVVMLRFAGREYRPLTGDSYDLTVRFEADDAERLYGMGQYQMPYLNLKGCQLELAPRNTQASVPFAVSSKGYGLLWNNPAAGEAGFYNNMTQFHAGSAKEIDYWITAGDTPAQIVEKYTAVTGRVPMMPEYGMGFWQCKLRYCTQEEVLQVARTYKEKGIPLDVIVIDFFHWPHQGDWCFDPEYWPDPKAMVDELHAMGTRVMVSVWPTVEDGSVNSMELMERGLVIRGNRGNDYAMSMTRVIDMTNPEARDFLWNTCRRNYADYGVDLFWLDEAEPEYTRPEFDAFRMWEGDAAENANLFSVGYAKAFYDGMRKSGNPAPLSLIRSGWAGIQRYGALVWSGDVPSTFTYLKYQVRAGLNMGLAGVAWWTADIGGFHGGNVNDPVFRELLLRWFAFGCFCPVMRLHGDRDPHKAALSETGGGVVSTGADNEVWSYGPEIENIMVKFIRIREAIRPYIRNAMQEAHEKGTPVIKPLFYDFPEDQTAWEVEDSYLFGHDLLVSPVTEQGALERKVYLPAGQNWVNVLTGESAEGGRTLTVPAPLDSLPLFAREGSDVIPMLQSVISACAPR